MKNLSFNPKKDRAARRPRIDWATREDVSLNCFGNRVLVGNPRLPGKSYFAGMTDKGSKREKSPRIQGTGDPDKRDFMRGKLKARCSGGAFGKGGSK